MAQQPANQTDDLRAAARPADQLPNWYPAWARELADLYFSGTTCVFVLHGNTNDLIHCPAGEARTPTRACRSSWPRRSSAAGTWCWATTSAAACGRRPAATPRAAAGDDAAALARLGGEPSTWPREADKVLALLEGLVERNLLDDPGVRKSVAVVFDHAEYLIPAGDLDSLVRGQAARLVRLVSWAQNPHIKRVNMAFCLIAERLAEVNDRLVQNPHVATVEIPLPDRDARLRFLRYATRNGDLSKLSDFSAEQLAEMSAGLSLVNLDVLLSQAASADQRIDARRLGS